MRNTALIVGFGCCFLIGICANSDTVIFQEHFDSYTAGQYLGDLPDWEPCFNASDASEEWYVTSVLSHSYS